MNLTRYVVIAVALIAAVTAAASNGNTPPGQAPPSVASPPAISGTPQVGLTLTGSPGAFSGPVSGETYQWLRCDVSGVSCGPISGATSTTYLMVAADYGLRLRFDVTASNRNGSTTSASALSSVVQAAPASPPSAVAPSASTSPTIAGSTIQGQTLSAASGSWSGTQPISFTSQWLRCDSSGNACAAIGGATGSSYLLTSADVSHALRVSFTGVNSVGQSTATSSPTAAVTAPTTATTTISPSTLPGATVGTAYSQTITASGTAGPYHFAVTSGSLPAGLVLLSSGALSGIPVTAGTFGFGVSALDGSDVSRASQAYSVAVAAPVVSGGAKLAWAPPALSSPVTLTLPSVAPLALSLDSTRDYVLKLGHLAGPGGLSVTGGHNVVIIGGQITAATDTVERDGWAMRFYNQTGTVHVEGVLIDNSNDGITIQAPSAIVQIENVRIANNHALQDNFSYAHPDLIQTWSGPSKVRIDRFTGYSDYQGFTWMNAGSGFSYPGSVTATNVNIVALAPQPNTVLKYPDGSTRDKPGLATGVWHVSSSTVFSCSSCFMTTGWYDQGYRRKLDDSIGGYMTSGGSYADPYYEFHGTDGAAYESPSNPSGGVKNRTRPRRLGRRQGDTMTWPQTANLANERWTWGVPPSGDFVPASVPGVNYLSPGYSSSPLLERSQPANGA